MRSKQVRLSKSPRRGPRAAPIWYHMRGELRGSVLTIKQRGRSVGSEANRPNAERSNEESSWASRTLHPVVPSCGPQAAHEYSR